jgi:DNA-binding MarR family transcriptional regulator
MTIFVYLCFMDSSKIDKQLMAFEGLQDKNWQRLVFNLKKHLDHWAHINIKPHWGQMKISYMPVICNISVDGSTTSELARMTMISKQNMSRTIRELEANGMIVSRINSNDKRSETLELTDSGKQLVLKANTDVFRMSTIYKKLIGTKDLEIAVNVLNKIIDYHERLAADNGQVLAD